MVTCGAWRQVLDSADDSKSATRCAAQRLLTMKKR
jgi:hypothetical protein